MGKHTVVTCDICGDTVYETEFRGKIKIILPKEKFIWEDIHLDCLNEIKDSIIKIASFNNENKTSTT